MLIPGHGLNLPMHFIDCALNVISMRSNKSSLFFVLPIVAIGFACGPKNNASSENLVALPLTKADSNLVAAKAAYAQNPTDENFIWVGRRLGYIADSLQASIDWYSQGLERNQLDYRFLRHRGHRFISNRQFALAIIDLEKAAQLMQGKPLEIEPDGIPNAINKPLSTTQFNVWYHLALAHYLAGNYDKAATAWKECLAVSDNDDSVVAACDWLYITYRRLGAKQAAEDILKQVQPNMTIVENDSYYQRLQMYQGKIPVDAVLSLDSGSSDYQLKLATNGYGVGNWHYLNGDTLMAKTLLGQVLKGKSKNAFGYIAAETDLKRLFNSQR